MATSVPEGLEEYSATAANNTPAGSTAIGSHLDDELRDMKANVARSARWIEDATVTDGTTMTTAKLNRITPVRAGSTTASVTLTAPTAAAAGDGWVTRLVKLSSTGKVIIEGNASETINGTLSYTMTASGGVVTLWCDGSNYRAIHDTPRDQVPVGAIAKTERTATAGSVSISATVNPTGVQINQGTEFLQLVYKPRRTGNILRVRAGALLQPATGMLSKTGGALLVYRGADTTAIAGTFAATDAVRSFLVEHEYTLTQSATVTIGVRAGIDLSGTNKVIRIRGDIFGGNTKSWLTLEEIQQ